MSTTPKLTEKQLRFVEAFDGNGTAAARAAGYKGNDKTLAQVAYENLRKPEVLAAIQARAQVSRGFLIATREQRQLLWTEVMFNPKARLVDRLRASELLGRSEADFTEKVLVQGKMTLEQLVEHAANGTTPPAPPSEGEPA